MISVTILTKNSGKYLREALGSLKAFDEVLIVDSGSTDNTLGIAGTFPNTRIVSTTFRGFGPLHNEAAALARHDWIFSLDSDEVVTPELQQELAQLKLEHGTVYSVRRNNYFNGKWIRGCGWYPDRQLRLYNRTATRFSDALVHESVITANLKVVHLENAVSHYSYERFGDFLAKAQRYSDLFAEQQQGKTRASVPKAILHGFGDFLKSYLLKRGFLFGAEGFVISVYNGEVAFYKYLKLLEANRALQRTGRNAET